AGKTTHVPPALLEADTADRGQIVMLEPRRLAARAAARRMAGERGERVGDAIGYQVRFDRQVGPRTRVLVVTPGILLRRLLAEPWPIAAAQATTRLLERTDGDILVFLPGMAEIRRTAAALESVAKQRELLVLPLHGDLPAEEQDRALLPQDRRRIVLATNVA